MVTVHCHFSIKYEHIVFQIKAIHFLNSNLKNEFWFCVINGVESFVCVFYRYRSCAVKIQYISDRLCIVRAPSCIMRDRSCTCIKIVRCYHCTFNANRSCPDTFNVSWHVESRMYTAWASLKFLLLLLTAILYPDIKPMEDKVDLFELERGNLHLISLSVLWLPGTCEVSKSHDVPFIVIYND